MKSERQNDINKFTIWKPNETIPRVCPRRRWSDLAGKDLRNHERREVSIK